MRERGFTFVEVVVALMIFTVLVLFLPGFYLFSYQSYVSTSDRVTVQENLRSALEEMSLKLRGAHPASLRLLPENSEVKTSVVFRVYSKDESGNVVAKEGGFGYDASGKEIEENFSGNWLPIASYVEELAFSYDSARRVLTVTVKGKKGRSGVVEMSTKIHLRVDPP